MNGFRIGALVIAKDENDTNPAAGNVRGRGLMKFARTCYFDPSIGGSGDAVRTGQAGELMDGPFNYGTGATRWHVKWADGNETASRQDFLMVIGDKAQDASRDTALTGNVPHGKVTA